MRICCRRSVKYPARRADTALSPPCSSHVTFLSRVGPPINCPPPTISLSSSSSFSLRSSTHSHSFSTVPASLSFRFINLLIFNPPAFTLLPPQSKQTTKSQKIIKNVVRNRRRRPRWLRRSMGKQLCTCPNCFSRHPHHNRGRHQL